MRQKKSFLVLVVGLAGLTVLANCSEPPIKDVNGDGKDDGVAATTVIAPSNPTGTVTGLVMNAATGQALPEGRSFSVQLIAGSYGGDSIGVTQEISDGSGQYRFLDVPAGQNITIIVKSEGFADALAKISLNSTLGNFFADNASISAPTLGLIELSGSFDVFLIAPDGRPVGNAEIYMDGDFSYLSDARPAGSLHLTATSGDDGIAHFTGLPNASLFAHNLGGHAFFISVPPQDLDGQEPADLAGTTRSITLTDMATQITPLTIALQSGNQAQDMRVVASNIADLVNQNASQPDAKPIASVLPKTGTLSIAFNQPIDRNSLLLRMVGEEGGNYLSLTIDDNSFNAYQNILTIPLPEAVQSGQEYNLFMEAHPASLTGEAYRGAVAFFIEPSDAEVSVLNFVHQENPNNDTAKIDGGDWIWFRLNMPVGARDEAGNPVSSTKMLPIHVQVSNTEIGQANDPVLPIEFGYQGDELPPQAYLVERLPESSTYVASGFTTWLRLQVPAGVEIPVGTSTWHFSFNDPLGANANQTYRAASPSGILPDPANRINTISLDDSYVYTAPDAGSEDSN